MAMASSEPLCIISAQIPDVPSISYPHNSKSECPVCDIICIAHINIKDSTFCTSYIKSYHHCIVELTIEFLHHNELYGKCFIWVVKVTQRPSNSIEIASV